MKILWKKLIYIVPTKPVNHLGKPGLELGSGVENDIKVFHKKH